MQSIGVADVAAFYRAALPRLLETASDTRTRCFLNCGRTCDTTDDALRFQGSPHGPLWQCTAEGCRKAGDLVALCDLLKPDRNHDGGPTGERLQHVLADVRQMVARRVHTIARGAEARTGEAVRMIPVPLPPQTGSPVPWLTSIHSSVNRGPYGSSRYRGNCSGYLIKDVLQFFEPKSVFDPMTGSGTCRDVCRELKIACRSEDIRTGFDAANENSFEGLGPFDFVWLHPPYWRQVKYNKDARCLSNAPTLDAFLERMRALIRNCRDVLTENGKLAILIGDYSDKGRQVPLVAPTKQFAIEEGLWPACTDIVRLQHGNTSSRRKYERSFIPNLHDICMIFEKANEQRTPQTAGEVNDESTARSIFTSFGRL